MTRSPHITLRRTGLALVAAIMTTVFAGSALAAPDRPAASFYTPQQLEAISQSWAARGGVFVDRPAASFYTPQQLGAISRSWAARGSASVPIATQATGAGLDWSDFGIGAGAMLGLVLLVGGVAAGAHYGRRGGVRARTVS
jgi:hypothetical protein